MLFCNSIYKSFYVTKKKYTAKKPYTFLKNIRVIYLFREGGGGCTQAIW